jgi:SAM-dependent methyltransferase
MARKAHSPYTADFYDDQREMSYSSAEVVVPRLLSLAQVRSAVDIGCGLGTWLKVLMAHGVSDVIGIDGDYVDRATIHIPADKFLARDIRQPLKLGRRFDLALSLEVAEHLPADCAEIFIESLTSLAPIVLFSAAIPFQGGTSHINEQWPEYWADIFRKHGFVPLDCIRRQIWNDARVEWWYAQNILVYANEEGLRKYQRLALHLENVAEQQLSVVHPSMYLLATAPPRPGVRRSLSLVVSAGRSAFLKRLKFVTNLLAMR